MNTDWQQAVDMRGELARFLRSESGVLFCEGYARSAKLDTHMTTHLNRYQRRLVENAEGTFWVAEDMCDLATYAADSLPRFELHKADLPTPSGFLMFERDLYFTDLYGRATGFRAIAWQPYVGYKPEDTERKVVSHTGIITTLYSDKHANGDWYLRHLQGLPVDPPPPPDYEEYNHERDDLWKIMPRYSIAHVDTWRFGDDHGDLESQVTAAVQRDYDDANEEMEQRAIAVAIFLRRFMLATWVLMMQPVAGVASQRLPRHALKRAERQYTTLSEAERVQVITLRRPAESRESDVEHTGRHLQTRHIRRGFWRQQWYATEGRHKPLWIESTVVGPEGAPLVNKHKVFQWVR